MIVCPFCSEEHPVTLDRCPVTGQKLREPAAVEASAAPQQRAAFGALLADAGRLYRRNLLVFLVTSSVAFVPFAALQVWSLVHFVPTESANQAMRTSMRVARQQRPLSAEEQAELRRALEAARPDPKKFLLTMVLILMLAPVFVASQTLAHAALVPLIGDRSLGGKMGPGRAWLAVGMRAGAILWTAALSTLVTMIGFLFCIVPGILAAVGFALTMPVVLLERRRGIDALRRSWSLMRTEWPRVVGLWLVAVAGMMVVVSVFSIAFLHSVDPSEMSVPSSAWTLIGYGGQIFIPLLFFPLPVIGTTLVYLHARLEQENVPLAELQLQMVRAASGT